jgi:alkylation response protein AidB-like acyl-CoA dehydrogenase
VTVAEAADFADAVATATERSLGPAPEWRPGEIVDDRSPALSAALAEIGWLDLARDPELAPLAGAAAVGLGRRLAPLAEVDALLGGSPLAGDLMRYGPRAAYDDTGIAVAAGGARVLVERSEPVAYGDALGVHRVCASSRDGRVGPAALAAWTAASTGYLAGLCGWALDTTLDHVRSRRAFDTTLAGLAPVQQQLADAATATRGLLLLAGEPPAPAALAHAGEAAVAVTATCQQLAGAVGFTLEFPLQRAYRRARAAQLWADALLTAPSR